MKNSISKSVWIIIVIGLGFSIAAVWYRLHHLGAPLSDVAQGVAPAQTAAPTKTAAAAPAPPAAKNNNPDLLPVIPISLTNVITTTEDTMYHTDLGMQTFPSGTHDLGGIEFWFQGMIYLQGVATREADNRDVRANIDVPLDETNYSDGKISVNERGKAISCIYLVGATGYSSQPGQSLADLVWHYADQSTARTPIIYDVHLRDWWRTTFEEPAQLPNTLTKVAWHGPNPTRGSGTVRLYRVAFLNPHPEKTIHSLEFASTMTRASLFVAALTLDPLPPGSRPDNLTSREETDPELNGQLQLYVQDSQGRPLAEVQIAADSRSKSAGNASQRFSTDNNGMALVRYPDSELQTLDVTANHAGYSGRKMLWDTSSGDTVPANYTLKLSAEVQIGGIVVDPEYNPISGASVSFYRFWTGGDIGPNRKGEQAAFSRQQQTTDDQGRWQARGLPPELLDHIGFDVKHPGFISTNFTVGADSTTEKQLRGGTHRTVLQRGQAVSGRVIDDNNHPVSGATIWAGRKFYRDRQQTTSDSQGHFTFDSVNGGDTLFSVMAKGHSPDTKTVNVQPGMQEIVFQLKDGSTISAHVQDESGTALPGCRVSLEGNPGDPAYDAYDFSTSTDTQGNFSWDSAPAHAMPFYISHDGFEQKRGIKLASNQPNTVTLRRSRQLEGLVLDATTQQPVTNFSIRTGTAAGNGTEVYGVVQYKDYTAADGRFTTGISEESANAVMVYADGYADQLVNFPEAQNSVIQLTAQMNPSPGINGVVLAPDGMPAPGVNVAAVANAQQFGIQLTGGHLRSSSSSGKMATTDTDGRFTLSSVPVDGTVVASGEPGFARAPVPDVRSSKTVALQTWGRIEGTLKIGGQPAAGRELLFNPDIPGVTADFTGYKSSTDDDGQFTMEKIPPGDGAIVRLIKASQNSWMHSASTPVTVKSGETTQVTLGGNGAVLAGRIRFDNPPTNVAAVSFQGFLSSPMPSSGHFNSPQESQAYFSSPEFRAAAKLRKHYAIEMSPNGAFTVDDVTPGNYSLSVTANVAGARPWEQPIGHGSLQVSVPDSFSSTSPIDIGEVVLTPSTP